MKIRSFIGRLHLLPIVSTKRWGSFAFRFKGVGRIQVIVVYDVNVKRVAKVLKTCRKYLYWVQNSVLEGEISDANLVKLKTELAGIIE